MKTLKMTLAILLAAAMCFAAWPASASGAEPEQTVKEYFTSRDLSAQYDADEAVQILLSGQTASADSDSVRIDGSRITITAGGTYLLSGSLTDGCVIVDAGKEDKVQLVLNGADIASADFAALYVASADKVFVTLADGTENTLSNGGTFTPIDSSDVDAVIYAKDDLTLNGSGSLKLTSPAGHGIVGKDDVTITGGSYEIASAKTAIRAKDHLNISGGEFLLNAGTDGLHAENKDDDTLGSVYIAGGSFTICAGDDGIHATPSLVIDGGTFRITAAEGMEATCITINDGDITIEASDDGINASQKSATGTPTVEINGGSIAITMGAGDTDGIDANGDIIINGGTVNVTGNSPFDYDRSGTINGGTVIANGQEITTLTNQMMGGRGGMGGKMQGMTGAAGGAWGTDGVSGATQNRTGDTAGRGQAARR